MIALFNIIIIGIVALIAYWWSNEGAFSGLMHLVCVLVAGAMAIALWEPLLFDLLFVDGAFGGLMPGFILISTFLIVLLLLRKGADLAAPEAAFMPEGFDAVAGGVFGACSGVLTVGILLVGIGFIHQPLEILGYSGWSRQSTADMRQGLVAKPEAGLWLPADALTIQLYELVSLTTLKPDIPGAAPLALANPHLDRLAWLVRDTVKDDKNRLGATVMSPDAVTIAGSFRAAADTSGEFLLVTLKINKRGFDFKGALVLSSSQVRVIGTLDGLTQTYHPAAWGQPGSKEEDAAIVFRAFDADDRFATSPTARADADLRLVFAVDTGFDPDYIQLRGTRFNLGTADDGGSQKALLARAGGSEIVEDGLQFGGDISGMVQTGSIAARFDRKFKPSTEKVDSMGATWRTEDNRIVSIRGETKPNRPGENPRGKLAMRGYHVDQGGSLVRVACHPGTITDIFTAARKFRLPSSARIQLLDVDNNDWTPIGFEMVQANRIVVSFRDDTLDTIADLPARPRSGSKDRFFLLFEVPDGTQLSEIRLDEELLGTISGMTSKRYVR
jgi:hypothetical protein